MLKRNKQSRHEIIQTTKEASLERPVQSPQCNILEKVKAYQQYKDHCGHHKKEGGTSW